MTFIRPEDMVLDQTRALDRRGRVYKGKWVREGKEMGAIAVKILSQDGTATFEALAERGTIWAKLDHSNVLKIFGVAHQCADPLFVVSEYHQRGNLADYLRRNLIANRPQLVRDIACGMQYLHSSGIVHGGLKTTDVLIAEDGRACVADYDMVKIEGVSEGTEAHRYFSPEAWKGTVSRPSDVYAFAMCAFEAFSSVPPWGDLAEKHIYRSVVLENVRPSRPSSSQCLFAGLTDQIWGIIEESWHTEARFRPTFDIIVKMWPDEEDWVKSGGLQRSISLVSRPILSQVDTTSLSPTTNLNPTPITPFSPTTPNSIRIRPLPSLPHESGHASPSHPPSTPASSAIDISPSPPHMQVEVSTLRMSHAGGRRVLPQTRRPSTADNKVMASKAPKKSTHHGRELSTQVGRSSSAKPVLRRTATASGSLTQTSEEHSRRNRDTRGTSTVTNMSPIAEAISPSRDVGSALVYSGAGPVILAGALQSVVQENEKNDAVIDDYLVKIYRQASPSETATSKFVAAGTVPILIKILKARSNEGEEGLEGLIPVLITLGTLAYDPITSNIMQRTGAATTIMELFLSSSHSISALSAWCLTRATKNTETATSLVKSGLPKLLLKHGLRKRQRRPLVARYAAWCLGNLIHCDLTSEIFASAEHLSDVVHYLEQCSQLGTPSEDTCSALYLLARVSRSVKIAKELANRGCIHHLSHHLNTSNNPDVLRWGARAAGCLMRPNNGEMAKTLLRAGVASGLARLPRVLPADEVLPLGCFAFAIQRFSYAEWGGGTRKGLVEAGVVDSLLAALRRAADVPCPLVHTELALAVSSLGDVGGAAVRKEIVNAGGLAILKKLAMVAGPGTEIAKTCNMAVTSISGNIFTRHAASARTALKHSWLGGCPEHQPPCPLIFGE
ncbi:hypothetical protein PQX77_008934 [Marasmius sp. AFHP31]|nr:hypothetical protein PQX77_008934 [Marasmius sp. AFHP31]